MWGWNGTVHRSTSNWRELRAVMETLKREEVVFSKLRGGVFFYFTDNEVTYNIFVRKIRPRPSHCTC
jgi:hypothetical protein